MDISLGGIGRGGKRNVGGAGKFRNSAVEANFADILKQKNVDMEIKAVKVSREKPETKTIAVVQLEAGKVEAADEAIIRARAILGEMKLY
jgi:hypothetical protein